MLSKTRLFFVMSRQPAAEALGQLLSRVRKEMHGENSAPKTEGERNQQQSGESDSIPYILTWNPNDLYFWRSTPPKKGPVHSKQGYMIHVFGEEVPLTLTTTKDNDSEKWYSNFLVDQQRGLCQKKMPPYSLKFEILQHFISVLNSLILATRHVGEFQIMTSHETCLEITMFIHEQNWQLQSCSRICLRLVWTKTLRPTRKWPVDGQLIHRSSRNFCLISTSNSTILN